ncbi:DMT family transporter (plasmid) [Agrobacterium leguminum]|uniref:EamA domain-containing protein n=1 Tax=Agrobacterium deltaense NCPPB 1641 TaxID=1183425 RepID=A0A1S7UB09_9HYPH|nr:MULTISPECIES: DMT family transporter [Agrobacterium]WFS69763.1 DMT family transporter [Agrobacterium leguminum]CVI64074.1 conserved membrane hypothetical protein [Agrobacterium deltaense NCPPB 1641]
MIPRSSGYLFAVLACLIFAVQDGISKHLVAIYPPAFITMLRFWAFAVFALLLVARTRGGLARAAVSTRPWLQALRGGLLALQIVIAIHSFDIAGLAYTQSVFAAGPILVTALSVPILGEKVGWRRWLAVGAGLCGVLLIIGPFETDIGLRTMPPLVATVMLSLYVIATRMANRTDNSATSFLYTGVGGAIVMSFWGPFYWASFSGTDAILMLVLCCTSTSGHYCLIRAYEKLNAAEVQPIMYLQVVSALLVGATFFDEQITLSMIAGAAIVIAAGLFTAFRERSSAASRSR